jgi:hypothetical protein
MRGVRPTVRRRSGCGNAKILVVDDNQGVLGVRWTS